MQKSALLQNIKHTGPFHLVYQCRKNRIINAIKKFLYVLIVQYNHVTNNFYCRQIYETVYLYSCLSILLFLTNRHVVNFVTGGCVTGYNAIINQHLRINGGGVIAPAIFIYHVAYVIPPYNSMYNVHNMCDAHLKVSDCLATLKPFHPVF